MISSKEMFIEQREWEQHLVDFKNRNYHLLHSNDNEQMFNKDVEDLTGKTVWIASKGLNILFNKYLY